MRSLAVEDALLKYDLDKAPALVTYTGVVLSDAEARRDYLATKIQYRLSKLKLPSLTRKFIVNEQTIEVTGLRRTWSSWIGDDAVIFIEVGDESPLPYGAIIINFPHLAGEDEFDAAIDAAFEGIRL